MAKLKLPIFIHSKTDGGILTKSEQMSQSSDETSNIGT